jgi:hypothetical protein
MIPNQFVEVVIIKPSQVEHYSNLGYDVVSANKQILRIPPEHLPKGSQKIINVICDDCSADFKRKWVYVCWKDTMKHRCRSCTRKFHGSIQGKKRFGSNPLFGKKNHRWRPDRTKFNRYAKLVRRRTDRIYLLYTEEINPLNLPRAISGVDGGYQVDHIISVRKAFDIGMTVEDASAKENLQMLPWLDNALKCDK